MSNRFDSKDALLGHSYSKSVTSNWVLVLSNSSSAVSRSILNLLLVFEQKGKPKLKTQNLKEQRSLSSNTRFTYDTLSRIEGGGRQQLSPPRHPCFTDLGKKGIYFLSVITQDQTPVVANASFDRLLMRKKAISSSNYFPNVKKKVCPDLKITSIELQGRSLLMLNISERMRLYKINPQPLQLN